MTVQVCVIYQSSALRMSLSPEKWLPHLTLKEHGHFQALIPCDASHWSSLRGVLLFSDFGASQTHTKGNFGQLERGRQLVWPKTCPLEQRYILEQLPTSALEIPRGSTSGRNLQVGQVWMAFGCQEAPCIRKQQKVSWTYIHHLEALSTELG